MVGFFDLHLDLQSAFLPVRLGRDLGDVALIDFVEVSLRADTAALLQRDFWKVVFVNVDLHLQVVRVREREERCARPFAAAK